MQRSAQDLAATIAAYPGLLETCKGASERTINEAEEMIGMSFPPQLREYLGAWGTLSAGPLDFYGIPNDRLDTSSVPNAVWFTLRKRDQLGLPENLLVLLNCDGDDYHCINLATGGIEIWNTFSRSVVGEKSSDLISYLVQEVNSIVTDEFYVDPSQ